LAKGAAYKIYFGGSYSGGSFVGNTAGWGLYTGGTYSNSGATLKSTSTTSTSGTVNTIIFLKETECENGKKNVVAAAHLSAPNRQMLYS